MSPKVRILVAKPGLDGHDRGVKVIARALRDGGFEVLYTGLHQTPEQIVAAAIQEDVDAIGVSIMSGAHMTLVPRILDVLAAKDARDVVLFAGGIIPDADAAQLKEMGVAEIFTPGTSTDAVVDWARRSISPKTAVKEAS
jgi:methylmalonyl-CoA mutase C-terminal domain/subunit